MTSPLERHLEAAREALAPDWDEARAQRVEAGLPQRARALRRARVLQLSSAVAVVVVAGALLLPRARGGDAVVVEPLAAGVAVELPGRPDERTFEVTAGAVRFVAKVGRAPVRVVAGDVEVVVRDTRVLVERASSRARVLVEEGSAQVRWPGGSTQLPAGEPRWFPPEPQPTAEQPQPPAEPVPAAPEEAPVAAPKLRPVSVVAPPAPAAVLPEPEVAPTPALASWKDLAQAGDYAAAWEALRAVTPADETGELLLAADVARLSGHADAAVAPLRRVVDAHASDARASLAAFTLGRVLLDDLGRPAEAAQAFERARTLAPSTRLSEDALARQVEAAFRAQDPRARELAERFVKDFPSSPRLRAVRYFGGLEK